MQRACAQPEALVELHARLHAVPAPVAPPSSEALPVVSFLSTMLITPAMASEPYCAAAPSRSTSTRPMALEAIRSRSGGDWPDWVVPLMNMVAVLWRRLPLTSTSTSSLDRPRSDRVLTAKLAPDPRSTR
jgi:hypothetical protein